VSSRRLVNLDPFAAAIERREQAARANTLAHSATVAPETTVAQQAVEPLHGATVAPETTVARQTTVARRAIVETQYTAVPNGVWDELMPTLDVYDQSIVWHLYRLSRGFHSDTCRISLDALAKRCNIGKRQVSKSLDRLEARGIIIRQSTDYGNPDKTKRGTTYKVNLPAARAAPRATVAPQTTLASSATVAPRTTNKENTLKETHTNTDGVRVGSRFDLQECRRFAEHLRSSGQGINNPGGYATKIHRSGEADELIASFLAPAEAAPSVDVSQCPDCRGTGFWEPGGVGKGVAKCKHERLEPRQTHCT
jgi:DNA-binding Lrp family transcriptional regulator